MQEDRTYKDIAKKIINDGIAEYESKKKLCSAIHMVFKDSKTLKTELNMFSGDFQDNPDTAKFMKGIVKDVRSKLGAIVVMVQAYRSFVDSGITNPQIALMQLEENKQEIILVYFEDLREIKMRVVEVNDGKILEVGEWDKDCGHWSGLFWNLGLYESESLGIMYS
jgi:hypothetical protein